MEISRKDEIIKGEKKTSEFLIGIIAALLISVIFEIFYDIIDINKLNSKGIFIIFSFCLLGLIISYSLYKKIHLGDLFECRVRLFLNEKWEKQQAIDFIVNEFKKRYNKKEGSIYIHKSIFNTRIGRKKRAIFPSVTHLDGKYVISKSIFNQISTPNYIYFSVERDKIITISLLMVCDRFGISIFHFLKEVIIDLESKKIIHKKKYSEIGYFFAHLLFPIIKKGDSVPNDY